MTNDTNGTTDYAATVEALEAEGWPPERILNGLGHPGHSGRTARRYVRRIRRGRTPDQAVYGRRQARLNDIEGGLR